MNANPLAEYRKEIDALDDQIVDLLSRRFAIASEVAAYKAMSGIAVRLEDRIAEVLERNANRATKNGAEAEAIRAIYKTIIDVTCAYEEAKISKSG
jgi:chorismate mutase